MSNILAPYPPDPGKMSDFIQHLGSEFWIKTSKNNYLTEIKPPRMVAGLCNFMR